MKSTNFCTIPYHLIWKNEIGRKKRQDRNCQVVAHNNTKKSKVEIPDSTSVVHVLSDIAIRQNPEQKEFLYKLKLSGGKT